MGKTIYFYSATGNSLYIAKKIARGINAKLVPLAGQKTVCDSEVIGIVYPAFDQDCDIYFSINESCVGCGLCDKICPVNNIEIVDGKPQFLHHCDHCLGCLNLCPQDAINWKDKTVGKKRYKNSHVTVKELIDFRNKKKD